MADLKNEEDIKQIIVDPKSHVTYERKNFLGKGGFAKCYEFKTVATSEVFAAKVVSKQRLGKQHDRDKILQEISIHSTMAHKYIVYMHSYFEDENNIYIILELCRKRTLMEMLKRRKMLTLSEVRYFMRQIVLACKYIHEKKVIHRDLKLSNLFINDDMEIKVGDFGLATRMNYEGDRKRTICGTPNYIAREILCRDGYSYEADIWSLGCIMYALLVGSLPFESYSLKSTFEKIKNNDYFLPHMLDSSAKQLIQKLLSSNPECRPKATEILEEDFFQTDYIPSRIPSSCLIMQPRRIHNLTLLEESKCSEKPPINKNSTIDVFTLTAATSNMAITTRRCDETSASQVTMPKDFYLRDLLSMVESVVNSKAEVINKTNDEDIQDPSSVPFVWISKWVDYTDTYGLGYQLCDNSLGVYFNDFTHLILLADGKTLQYIDNNNEQRFFSKENYPTELKKKIKLLSYFQTYMLETLKAAGENAIPREGDEMTQVPHLRTWMRDETAIIFHLTNGTCQVNFFQDHTKIILCPHMGAVSFVDEDKNFNVYTFKLIEKYGCPEILASRLRYVKRMLDKLYADLENAENQRKSIIKF